MWKFEDTQWADSNSWQPAALSHTSPRDGRRALYGAVNGRHC